MRAKKQPLDDRAHEVVDPESTRWRHTRVKIARPPEAMSTRGRRPLRLGHLSRRDPRKPLAMTIKYRGGPECWYEIETRGVVVRVIGATALHDLMHSLNRQDGA